MNGLSVGTGRSLLRDFPARLPGPFLDDGIVMGNQPIRITTNVANRGPEDVTVKAVKLSGFDGDASACPLGRDGRGQARGTAADHEHVDGGAGRHAAESYQGTRVILIMFISVAYSRTTR